MKCSCRYRKLPANNILSWQWILRRLKKYEHQHVLWLNDKSLRYTESHTQSHMSKLARQRQQMYILSPNVKLVSKQWTTYLHLNLDLECILERLNLECILEWLNLERQLCPLHWLSSLTERKKKYMFHFAPYGINVHIKYSIFDNH